MSRRIVGLSLTLARNLCNELPRLGIIEQHINDNLVTLILDDPVIMKVYDDHIILDLGSRKAFINSNDFDFIDIR